MTETFIFDVAPPPSYQANVWKGASGQRRKPKLVEYQEELGYRAISEINKTGWKKPMKPTKICMDVDIYQKGKKRSDRDNMMKTLQDAFNGILYEDDAQIYDGRTTIIDQQDFNRIHVSITPLTV